MTHQKKIPTRNDNPNLMIVGGTVSKKSDKPFARNIKSANLNRRPSKFRNQVIGSIDTIKVLNHYKLQEEESKRNRSMLSVGSRALSKHAHRSSEGFWGNVRGSEQKKNELANEVLAKILNQAVWINIHNLPHDEPVIEIRVAKGYGARWSVNNS